MLTGWMMKNYFKKHQTSILLARKLDTMVLWERIPNDSLNDTKRNRKRNKSKIICENNPA